MSRTFKDTRKYKQEMAKKYNNFTFGAYYNSSLKKKYRKSERAKLNQPIKNSKEILPKRKPFIL